MGPFEILFWILIGILGLIAVLAVVGLIQRKRNAAKGNPDPAGEPELLPEKTVENVHDLNDRFNRARYMGKDGE